MRRSGSRTEGGPCAARATTRPLLGFAAFVAIGWAVGEVWTSIVGSVEQEAMRRLAEERTETLIGLARAITWAGSAFLLVPLAFGGCLVMLRVGLRRDAIAVAVSLGGAMLISDLVKLLTSRPRPTVEHLQAVTGSSFPSGHATQAAAFWLALALVLRAPPASRWLALVARLAAVLLALGVAWSRVYLGVHYPSDVLAGLALGGCWAVFVTAALRAPSSA